LYQFFNSFKNYQKILFDQKQIIKIFSGFLGPTRNIQPGRNWAHPLLLSAGALLSCIIYRTSGPFQPFVVTKKIRMSINKLNRAQPKEKKNHKFLIDMTPSRGYMDCVCALISLELHKSRKFGAFISFVFSDIQLEKVFLLKCRRIFFDFLLARELF